MNTSCPFGASSWATCPITLGVVWWLIASMLLWLTWNKVIIQYVKLKKASFKQAALLLGTIVILCLPCKMAKHCGGHDCGKAGCPWGKSATPKAP